MENTSNSSVASSEENSGVESSKERYRNVFILLIALRFTISVLLKMIKNKTNQNEEELASKHVKTRHKS